MPPPPPRSSLHPAPLHFYSNPPPASRVILPYSWWWVSQRYCCAALLCAGRASVAERNSASSPRMAAPVRNVRLGSGPRLAATLAPDALQALRALMEFATNAITAPCQQAERPRATSARRARRRIPTTRHASARLVSTTAQQLGQSPA